jgi:hypothetical protein
LRLLTIPLAAVLWTFATGSARAAVVEASQEIPGRLTIALNDPGAGASTCRPTVVSMAELGVVGSATVMLGATCTWNVSAVKGDGWSLSTGVTNGAVARPKVDFVPERQSRVPRLFKYLVTVENTPAAEDIIATAYTPTVF